MIASLLFAAVVAPQIPPITISMPARTGPTERQLLAWMPGPVKCDGTQMAATPMRRPLTGLVWQGEAEGLRTVTYRFRIDDAGRPLSIARDGTGYVVQGEDIAPSLAASRFPAGPGRAGCAITYTARLIPLAEAPVADLMSYTLTPTAGALPPAGWKRITPAGATCRTDPRPQVLVQVSPEFLKLPATPGVRNWSMVGYDIDAQGRPTRVRIVQGTGNAALDAASVKAMKASRFTRGLRTGCLYPFWRAPATMAAPPAPDKPAGGPATGACPAGDAWSYRQPPTYPEPWRRRGIEGWAVVAFDVAPWGELGNLRVVASEPSAEFGAEALRLLRGSTKPASATGRSGCVDRVRFVMQPKVAAVGNGPQTGD